MIGGYQILDLRSIDLQKSGSASSITDPYVLKQLLMFRDHIDKAYNFAKPLVNQLKPVLVRFRDKKSGEKTEGATFGELSVDGNYYTFKVTARISGALVLRISVAFEEITNDYGNKEWVIDTATIQLKDESKTITGDLELTGDLSVGDEVSISGDTTIAHNKAIKSGSNMIKVEDTNNRILLDGKTYVDGSFEQNDYNWESSNLQIASDWLNGLTANNSFVKIAKVNKELHVIISAELENETEESITTGSNLSIIALSNIPSEIVSKIYRKDGTNCNQAYTDSDVILSSPISFSDINGLNYEQKCGLLYSNNPGVLALWLAYGVNITIGAGQKKFIDYRVQILL